MLRFRTVVDEEPIPGADLVMPEYSYVVEVHDTLAEMRMAYDRLEDEPGAAERAGATGAFFRGTTSDEDGKLFLGTILMCRSELSLDTIAHEALHAAVFAAQAHFGHIGKAFRGKLHLPSGEDPKNREEFIAYIVGPMTLTIAEHALGIDPYAPEVAYEEDAAA
ncbi:hypothetical protein ACWEQ4_00865 [Rhodococcus sp. NPDC003994]